MQAAGSGSPLGRRDRVEIAGSYRRSRKALGTEAFGYNLVEIAPGGEMPEHEESGGQVEVYVVLSGDAVVAIDGEEHPAPAGTFASIEPSSSRTIRNRSEAPVTAMLIGVLPTADYAPTTWA